MTNNNVNNNGNKISQGNSNRADLERGKYIDDSSDTNQCKVLIMVVTFAALGAAAAMTWLYQDWETSLIVLGVGIVVLQFVFNWWWWYVALKTAPRDLKALYCYIRLLSLTRRLERENKGMPDIVHDLVKKHPDKSCFLFENEKWSFLKVEQFSLRVSAVLRKEGVKKGSIVAVMMNNCPELPCTWLGIGRLGGVSPLINTNQTGNTLLHSFTIAKCDAIIYGSEFDSAIQEIRGELDPSIKLYKFTRRPLNPSNYTVKVADDSPVDFTGLLETTPAAQWFKSEGDGFNGKLLYIYTSGTTGLPKAAIISSSRMVFMSTGNHFLGGLNSSDVIYCPMPLYHSAGGCVSVGQAFIFGCTLAIRAKFSASSYFPDCIKFNATAAHYIGEMCRYILTTPPAPTDTQHKVRIVFGNGMRPAIWGEFVKRFNIPRVSEFYGATEGNANIINNDNTYGAIGFVSRVIPAIYPISIIKVDQDTGEPIRNRKGLCQLAKPNEPGAFIGKINPNLASRAYLGYVDKEESEKKVVKDVFTHGDCAFISGDILVADDFGYLFFKDRTGDTFRWRGENVSTTEVEATISKIAGQRDAVVYGVEVPNTEGRAGMCGIVEPSGELDLEQLAKDMAKDLPKYARPIFIRVMTTVDMTGTFKMRKVDLLKEGYNPALVKDKLFYLDPATNKYLPLGQAEYDKIVAGQIRL